MEKILKNIARDVMALETDKTLIQRSLDSLTLSNSLVLRVNQPNSECFFLQSAK